ncbi:hypothetical protein AYL99_09889 [Fonsecaea erecta]|uniref:Fucose-specific lectin n=1 Tax=Fonsecaea erecta TaxID=1367422 RepID=A0A178Z7J9_9EURO|nr:hypothetical protein AYL99_09889 [Fonsecaea erecta]OAP55737.1 hypothetical protein AYL99_09889 [Fonsecaea erecta]
MGSYTIRIKNQSPKSQTYTVCSEEVYILESAKNVLVSSMVNPGSSCDIVINDKFYVWAKPASSSPREVISEVGIGAALLLKSDGQQAAIQKIEGVPEPGCFSISIDPSFLDSGVFGLGLKASSSAVFHPLTTTEATEIATYNIQPSRIFEVAVNERYKDGDELLSSVPPALSVTVDFEAGTRFITVVHGTNGAAAEVLSVEDPMVMKKLQEEMDRVNKEMEEEKRRAAAAAEQKRQTEKLAAEKLAAEKIAAEKVAAEKLAAEKIAAEKVAAEKVAAERLAAEKVAAEKVATEGVAAEKARNLQNQSILSGHSIAATAWSAWHMRVYFQDGRGGVRESRHDDGVWSGGDARSVLFTTKMGTPLSVISWDNGQKIRIYYLSSQDILQEYCYSAGYGWFHGSLNGQSIRVAPGSKISAIYWPVDTSIRATSWAIQEYCYCGQSGWGRGATLWNARPGSSIAATRWFSGPLDSVHRNLHIRIYYQDEQSYIRELCWQVGGWSIGGFSQRALAATPIAAIAWQDHQVNIRVFWQDNSKVLFESKYANAWAGPSNVTNDADEHCPFTAVELQNGQHHRIYLRDRTALVEKCNGKYGYYWFTGAFVFQHLSVELSPEDKDLSLDLGLVPPERF